MRIAVPRALLLPQFELMNPRFDIAQGRGEPANQLGYGPINDDQNQKAHDSRFSGRCVEIDYRPDGEEHKADPHDCDLRLRGRISPALGEYRTVRIVEEYLWEARILTADIERL